MRCPRTRPSAATSGAPDAPWPPHRYKIPAPPDPCCPRRDLPAFRTHAPRRCQATHTASQTIVPRARAGRVPSSVHHAHQHMPPLRRPCARDQRQPSHPADSADAFALPSVEDSAQLAVHLPIRPAPRPAARSAARLRRSDRGHRSMNAGTSRPDPARQARPGRCSARVARIRHAHA